MNKILAPQRSIDPRTIRIPKPRQSDQPALPVESSNNVVRDPQPIEPERIVSKMALSDWRGSVTAFNGFSGTRPDLELKGAGWDEICNLLRPPKAAVLFEKMNGSYVVPCLLKDAPLVGRTLEAAKNNGTPTSGKMRSKDHVTKAPILLIDIDGLSDEEFISCQDKTKSDGLTYLIYTTHSHGKLEKPGVRARIVIPLDREVNAEEYTAIWHGFDKRYFGGKVGVADSSGAKMYQQQGTWCCHPDRIEQAKSWIHKAGVVSADYLIELGRVPEVPKISKEKFPSNGRTAPTKPLLPVSLVAVSGSSLHKLEALLASIDPDCGYDAWLHVAMAVFHETQN